MPAPCLSWTKHIVTGALAPPLPQQKGHCQDRQAEHLWQVSQVTDPSWRKPTKCLISTTVFCRRAHAHTQTSAWTVFSPEPTATRATPCTLRLHSLPRELCSSPSATAGESQQTHPKTPEERLSKWKPNCILYERHTCEAYTYLSVCGRSV